MRGVACVTMDPVSGCGPMIFLVDAGPDAGLGHVQRCLALAHALRGLGFDSVFLPGPDASVRRRIAAQGFQCAGETRPGSDGQDLRGLVEVAQQLQAGGVVIDSYRLSPRRLAGLRETGLIVAMIDDVGSESLPCHLVISPGFVRWKAATGTPAGKHRLLGPSYALLGPDYWQRDRRATRGEIRKIVVTLGGSGSPALLRRAVSWLEPFAKTITVAVVKGPYLSALPELPGCEILVLEAPDSLAPWLREADLAISGGGQTLYELAAVGTPAVAIELARNQRDTVRGMAAAGAAIPAGRAADPRLDEAGRRAVQRLMRNALLRRRMSAAGQRLIDGGGAARVADALRDLLRAAQPAMARA